MPVTIQRASAGDSHEILALLSDSGLPTDGVLDCLDTALVARRDDHVVGCVALEVYSDGALLRSIAVDRAQQGRGIGGALTAAALHLARTLSVVEVYLLTTTAEDFFPTFGFRQISRDAVPPGVETSVEFRSACPSSATVMRVTL